MIEYVCYKLNLVVILMKLVGELTEVLHMLSSGPRLSVCRMCGVQGHPYARGMHMGR